MPVPRNRQLDSKVETLLSELEHLRELVFQRLDAEKDTRERQALEYERRLSELNESRAEAREKFNDYLDKKQFDIQHAEMEKRIELNNSQLIGMANLPADIRALFAWKEDISKAMVNLPGMAIDVKTLMEWRYRVLGMAVGAGAVAGLVTHWLLK